MKPIKAIFLTIIFFLSLQNGFAQTAAELQATARSFMQQNDYVNAIVVLNRATQMDPQNIEISKDLSLSYYMQRDNTKALEIIKPVLDKDEADDRKMLVEKAKIRRKLAKIIRATEDLGVVSEWLLLQLQLQL